jgi:hypothetical protein
MATSQTEVSINNRLYLEKANEEVSKIVIIPEWQKLLRSFECELSATKYSFDGLRAIEMAIAANPLLNNEDRLVLVQEFISKNNHE